MFDGSIYRNSIDKLEVILTKVIQSIDINSSDRVELVAATSFQKIRQGFVASIKLLEHEMYTEASYIVRVILESLFILKYLNIDSKDTLKRLEHNDEYQRNLFLYHCKTSEDYESVRTEMGIEKISKKDESRPSNNKETTIYKWAVLARAADLYVYVYNSYSRESHTSLTSLSNLLDSKDDQSIHFKERLDPNDIHGLYHILQVILIQALRVINEIFEKEYKQEIDEYEKIILKQANDVIKSLK